MKLSSKEFLIRSTIIWISYPLSADVVTAVVAAVTTAVTAAIIATAAAYKGMHVNRL